MITGRGKSFLTNAVAANKKIKAISVHHEQSAAFATVAYAQYNQKIGVCLVLNRVCKHKYYYWVLNAWQDGVPCFVYLWTKQTSWNI